MHLTATAHTPARRRATVAALFAVLCGAVILVGVAVQADASRAKILGHTKQVPKPACPKGDCEVMARVTGFQKEASGKKRLFRVPSRGHIVAWSVKLSRPNQNQRDAFIREDLDFGKPAVNLAVLNKRNQNKYRLKAKSPTIALTGDYGEKPIFTLRKPIKVRKGWIVALSTSSWVPNFANDVRTGANAWRASRPGRKCNDSQFLRKESRPHRTVGSDRAYGCNYTGARLLYWAYFKSRDGG